MPQAAAEIPAELSPSAQVKLVLMRGLIGHLGRKFGREGIPSHGTWARASRELEVDDATVSRLRAERMEHFSLERLIEMCDRVGVSITIVVR